MLKVMRDILQSRYMRSNVAHKQLARTSLGKKVIQSNFILFVFEQKLSINLPSLHLKTFVSLCLNFKKIQIFFSLIRFVIAVRVITHSSPWD